MASNLELTSGLELATALEGPIPSLFLVDPRDPPPRISDWCPPSPSLFEYEITPVNCYELVLLDVLNRKRESVDRPGVGLFKSHFTLGRTAKSTCGEKSVSCAPGEVTPFDRWCKGSKSQPPAVLRENSSPFSLDRNSDETWDLVNSFGGHKELAIALRLMKTLIQLKKEFAHKAECAARWKYWVTSQKEEKVSDTVVARERGPLSPKEKKAMILRFSQKQRKAAAEWRDTYKERSTHVHPAILVESTPSPQIDPKDCWAIPSRLLPPTVRYFTNGSPAVKGNLLHSSIFLGEFAEAISFILSAFGIRKDIRPALLKSTRGLSCKEIKRFIADESQFPMAYCLKQDTPDSRLWDKSMRRRFRQFNVAQPSKPKRAAIALCFSILMTKKYFGDLCDCDFPDAVRGHKERLTRTPPHVSPAAHAAIVSAVDELVKPEWFDKYPALCSSIALPNRSYLNLPRSKGGLHDAIVEEDCEIVNGRTRSHQEFIDTLCVSPAGKWVTIVQSYLENESVVEARYVGGPLKNRGVTINHPAHFLLKGVQMALHKGLKKDARFQFIGKPIRDADLGMDSERSWLVSGDYEAATDNFPPEVTQAVWSAIKKKLKNVPDHIVEIGDRSLDPQTLVFPDGDVVTQRCGQLMGQLLSFPILCIVNYAAYSMRPSRERKHVRINGDDILFSRRWKRDVDAWFEDVKALGMVASKGKTYIHRDVCTMNSEVFRRSDGKLRRVPFIHSGYLRTTDGAAAQLHHFVRSFSSRTSRLARMYIEHHSLEESGLPIFGHEKIGGQGAVLTPEIKLARVLSKEAIVRQCLFSRYSHGGNPIRCARNGDRLFREFIKFEKNVAAIDRARLDEDRAKLEVLRSWASPYDLGDPTRDLSNYGVAKSLVDTLIWGGEGSNKEAYRPFMPNGDLPDLRTATRELKEFALRDPPRDGISLLEEFRAQLGV